MRNIFELNRDELSWLEDKFQRYHQLDKEIAVRKQELMSKEEDVNAGIKTNQVSRPVENQVVHYMSDSYIQMREEWKKAIDKVVDESSEEVKAIIKEKYWSDHNYMGWTEIGANHHISKSQIYRMRYDVLEAFAKEIGYI